jgi:hypothetical protein
MKLRIFGDSLRLRLARSEVETLLQQREVTDAIHFGARAELTYKLVCDAGIAEPVAELREQSITVRVPEDAALAWAGTEQVSLRGRQALGDGRELSLLVEKDFKCLAPRPGEEDYDGFVRPPGESSC